jgi:hypothetical protein
VTYGTCRLIIVDTNQLYIPGSAQYTWLSNELSSPATQAADFVIVFHHHPGWSEGWDSPGYDGDANVRNFLTPLYESSGKVNIVFMGHTHDYERGWKSGVYYVITGGGGSALDHWLQDWSYIDVYYAVYEYVILDLCQSYVQYRTYDLSGTVIDSLTFGTPISVSQPHPAEPKDLAMKIAPSPLAGAGTITLDLPSETRAWLECYDFSGGWVRMLATKVFPAGESYVRMETRDLPAGVYFVHLRTAAGADVSQRVVVTHGENSYLEHTGE